MKQREPWKVIVLGLITLGIYNLHWLYATSKELVARGQKIPPVILLLLPFFVMLALFVLLLIMTGAQNSGLGEATSQNTILNLLVFIGAFLAALAWIPVWLFWFYTYSQAVAAVTNNRMSLGMAYGLSILFSAYSIWFVWAGMIQYEFNKVSPETKTVR